MQRRALAHSERFSVDEVGAAQTQPGAARRGVLQAIEDQVEIPSLQGWDQVRPVVLLKFRAQAERASQTFRDLDLEADDHSWLARALVHVRLTALQITTPSEL